MAEGMEEAGEVDWGRHWRALKLFGAFCLIVAGLGASIVYIGPWVAFLPVFGWLYFTAYLAAR